MGTTNFVNAIISIGLHKMGKHLINIETVCFARKKSVMSKWLVWTCVPLWVLWGTFSLKLGGPKATTWKGRSGPLKYRRPAVKVRMCDSLLYPAVLMPL